MKKFSTTRFNANILVAAILLVAVIGIGYSVYRLQNIFLAENERSRLLLQERREHIENTAKQLFTQKLQEKVTAAIPIMHELIETPYLVAQGYYLNQNGKQLLPLDWHFSQMPRDNAKVHYQRLQSVVSDSEPDPEWHEDLNLLWRLVQAIRLQQDETIESAARSVMLYDANHRFASRHELVYRLVFVEQLAAYPQASRQLLARLIREDLRDDYGTALNALQKELLWRRNELSREEFDFLKQKIIALSKHQKIHSDDFKQAGTPNKASSLAVPVNKIQAPAIWKNAWYFEPSGSDIYGVAVDIESVKAEVIDSLMAQNWLKPGDSLELVSDVQLQTLSGIAFLWDSMQFQQNLSELERFHRLKQLILLAGVLSFVTGGLLIWWLYRSQARWIGVKSEFVATVAHEMRTPLSSIRLMAERLADTMKGESGAKDYPQRILADIDTLSFLSENILSFERLQSGKWIVHTSPLTMGEVVTYLQKELPLFVKKPFMLQTDGEHEDSVQADPTLIKLLFLNLGKNSCSYNSHGEAKLSIKWHRRQQSLIVDFVDNGIGIKADEWRDSFAPFYRGKNQRHTRGSGLGLALCQKIMTLHGGHIDIVASDHHGTHFRLIFPLRQQSRASNKHE